jgi:site-specific recombinase XerD
LCQITSNWSAPDVKVAVTFSMNTEYAIGTRVSLTRFALAHFSMMSMEASSAHWLRHAHASHAIDGGALVSQTLGHADLKTTSVYAHAKPIDSSTRYLKKM